MACLFHTGLAEFGFLRSMQESFQPLAAVVGAAKAPEDLCTWAADGRRPCYIITPAVQSSAADEPEPKRSCLNSRTHSGFKTARSSAVVEATYMSDVPSAKPRRYLVQWDRTTLSARSLVPGKTPPTTFAEHYKERYDIDIQDLDAPLLLAVAVASPATPLNLEAPRWAGAYACRP